MIYRILNGAEFRESFFFKQDFLAYKCYSVGFPFFMGIFTIFYNIRGLQNVTPKHFCQRRVYGTLNEW